MRLSGEEIMLATGGRWHGDTPAEIGGITTDTRAFQDGELFLALRGPNFDGHAFGVSVADRAVAMIGDHQGMHLWSALKVSKLEVDDTLQALGNIAHAWRKRLAQTTVIAVTGSYGKTSLRSILETGFAALGYNVSATRANLNNLIGVPQTLLAVPLEADIAVIECGISEKGEMARLAAMVEPDIAVLTGMTGAHAEGLGGISGVVREKSLLLESLRENGWCALGSGVSELLRKYHIVEPSGAIVADAADASDTVHWRLEGRKLMLSWQGEAAATELALPAAHWAANIALAASVMLRYLHGHDRKASLAEVAASLSGWQAPAGRMRQCEGINGMLVLDDCYNANPASMRAAIDTLRALDGGRIAVLGDMGELGEASETAHAGIDVDGLDRIYLVGLRMRALAARYPEAVWFASTDEAVAALAGERFDSGDTVLVKASRSMRLEKVVHLLCSKEAAHAL